MNIYSVLDKELERMHKLLGAYMALPASNNYMIPEIYKRIVVIQDSLLEAAKNNDELIQQKVAELAFTDSK
jgi:hypothetical protein